MAVEIYSTPTNIEEFDRLGNFEVFRLSNYEKGIYMKIPEVYMETSSSQLGYRNAVEISNDETVERYIFVNENRQIVPLKSRIQIFQ